MERPSSSNVATGLSAKEQLELRIKILEYEIPFYSNKAAEAMVQGVEDNTFKVETEKRLEELNRLKEELKRLNVPSTPNEQQGSGAGSIPPPPLQPSTPHGAQMPLPVGSPHSGTASAQQYPGAQGRPSTLVNGGAQSNSQQPQQPPPSRKQKAILSAEQRFRSTSPQDTAFLCSVFLDYSDLVSCACVNKYWRSRVRKTPGWRRDVLNLEQTLLGHVGKITALATFETLIVTGSNDGKIKFWDPNKSYTCVKTLNITPSPVHRYLHPKLREIKEQRMQSPPYIQPEDEEFAEYPLAVTSLLTVDRCLLIGVEDGRFIVWMAAYNTDRKDFDAQTHHKAITCIVLNETQDFIYTASLDGRIAAINRRGHPFNVNAPAVWQTPLYSNRKHDAGVVALAIAGGHIFSGSLDGKIYVWNPKGLEFRKTLSYNRGSGADGMPMIVEHTDRITSMVGFMDRLYTSSWDGTVKLWNARTLECLRDVPVAPIGICWSLAIRRDSLSRITTLIGGMRDTDICVMDWETLEVLSTCETNNWAYKLDQHSHWVRCIMAFADGRIVSGSDDWTVKVWHIRGSSQRNPSLFLGLPPGTLSTEDCDIILQQLVKRTQPLTIAQLQEQKTQHDNSWKDKISRSTAEQNRQNDALFAKAAEGWAKAREKRRAELAAAAHASSSSGSTTTTTNGSVPAAAAAAAAASVAPGGNDTSSLVPSTPGGGNVIGTPAASTVLPATPAAVVATDQPSASAEPATGDDSSGSTAAATAETGESRPKAEGQSERVDPSPSGAADTGAEVKVKQEPEENGLHNGETTETAAPEDVPDSASPVSNVSPEATAETPADDRMAAGTPVSVPGLAASSIPSTTEEQQPSASGVSASTSPSPEQHQAATVPSQTPAIDASAGASSAAADNGDSTTPDEEEDEQDGSESEQGTEAKKHSVKRRKIK